MTFSDKNSLGNTGWWNILRYLIQIGAWSAVIGMLRPRAYREYQDAYKKAQERD